MAPCGSDVINEKQYGMVCVRVGAHVSLFDGAKDGKPSTNASVHCRTCTMKAQVYQGMLAQPPAEAQRCSRDTPDSSHAV